MTQLAFDLGHLGLELDPTIAMRRGDQSVFQCAQCGTVVVQPRPASSKLMACPACERTDWLNERLPLAGLRNAAPA
jgi:uncharacterized paraquat-inducible protein A